MKKNHSLKIHILLFALLLTLQGAYCAPAAETPAVEIKTQAADGVKEISNKVKKKVYDSTKFNKEQNYIFQKLPSGQNIVVMPVHTNEIVTIDTWIKTGSINENEKNSGVAHFLEHLFFKGTEKHPTGEFDRMLESKGGLTNAATSKDYTHYYITIPSKEFDTALELHADMLLHPLIPRKELEKERKVVLEEIARGEDNPVAVMYNKLFNVIYTNQNPNHPYSRPVIGSNKVIETISREEILEFFNKWYSPDNMTTVIVGDVDPEHAVNKVAELFVDNNRVYTEGIYPKILPLTKQLRVETLKDVNTGYIAIAYKAPKFKDDKDSYALDVLAEILGNSRSAILNQKLKENKQLVYSITTGNSSLMDDGFFVIQASFKPENKKLVEEEVFKEIELVKKGQITDNDVKKAINMIKTSTYYARESVSNISNEMGYMTVFWGNTKYYDNYLSNIEKVTKQDVIRVAKKYLDKNKTAISTVMPQNPVKEGEKPISNISTKTEPAKKIESYGSADKYLLSNGATLIIKKNPVNSIVAIDIRAVGGTHLEKTAGTASLASMTAIKGTKKMTAEEIAQTLDEKGIKMSFSANSDTFGVSVLTTTNELDFALETLEDTINNPVFPSSEIEKSKKLMLAGFKKMRDSALNIATDDFKATAFKGSAYGKNSKEAEENLPKVTREEIIEYYNSTLEPKNLVISIVGNVDADKMAEVMTKIFKEKNQEKITLKELKIERFLPDEAIEKTLTKEDTKTAWILTGFKTSSAYELKDVATLKVINAILGEGMSSRLFRNLRDNQGLAYQVGSTISQNALDGAFIAYIGTNNNNIEIAKKGMLHEIYKLKSEYVSAKELQEAKDKILGNIIISLETNMDDASLLCGYGVLGYGLNRLEEYKNAIQEVTQADILAIANKYFSKPPIVIVVKNANSKDNSTDKMKQN